MNYSTRKLLASFEPKVLRAFLASFADIRNGIVLSEFEAFIAAGQYDRAIAAVGLTEARFALFTQALFDTYAASGLATSATVPKFKDPRTAATAVFRFNPRDVRAEGLAVQRQSLVKGVLDSTRDVIRTQIQQGLEAGLNPRQTARSIVGRYSRSARRRIGGVIGLSSPQAQWLRNARDELLDPAKMPNYFTRKLRDKRFDSVVVRAMEAGQPLDRVTAQRLLDRYSDRLLKSRGDTIARTETLNAVRQGNFDAGMQLIDGGGLSREQVSKEWNASGDDRTRDDHAAVHGQRVPMDNPFTLPDGSRLMYPGDSSLGAPADQTIQCRCDMRLRIDFLAGVS